MNKNKPNPDDLLTSLKIQEARERRGDFRLFFGMAAGVGKTCAMLKAAKEKISEGIDVKIGVLETHGRNLTAELAKGIPTINLSNILYRDTKHTEMNLDAILTERPSIVLVDELAHTNVPGSRHEKRYQDVIEILEAGITVYATLNVQHLESRADIVELITAAKIRETVPDSILDYVTQIDLIDLTPLELIDRLKEGKIYPGRKTEQALQYFFQEGNLNALREITLRVTADKVQRDMRDASFQSDSIQSGQDKGFILVAISHSPFSEKLLRTARRIVEDMELPWIAVHIDTGTILQPADHNQLVKNLDLAASLGADTLTLRGTDIVKTISDYIKEKNVVQVILGRPVTKKSIWTLPSQNIAERLIKANPDVDITVMHQPGTSSGKKSNTPSEIRRANLFETLKGILLLAVLASFNYLIQDIIGYRSVGFIFLLFILSTSLFLPFRSILITTTLCALVWDYFFIPPHGRLSIQTPEDIMLLITFFVSALISGYLTHQMKQNQLILKEREEKTRALFNILKSMTLVKETSELIKLALDNIKTLFSTNCAIILADNQQLKINPDYGTLQLSDSDMAVANWTYANGRMAGWGTQTLPLSSILCLAIKSGNDKFGVLALKSNTKNKLSPEQENLLISIVNQVGIILAREKFNEQTKQETLHLESEKLHATVLNCISHELRTPLTAIMGSATSLQAQFGTQYTTGPQNELVQDIINASQKLNHIFENLLDSTRIESGQINLRKEWFDLSDLIQETKSRTSHLVTNSIIFNNETKQAYFEGDFELLIHAISNILLNAAKYSPTKSEIHINLTQSDNTYVISIKDEGPGVPEAMLSSIFDKFFRVSSNTTTGLGLGLSIAKNIIELHKGQIQAHNGNPGGLEINLILPYQKNIALITE